MRAKHGRQPKKTYIKGAALERRILWIIYGDQTRILSHNKMKNEVIQNYDNCTKNPIGIQGIRYTRVA